jgi:hypothetical protein
MCVKKGRSFKGVKASLGKRKKTFLYSGFLGVKKCGNLWKFLPYTFVLVFLCFLSLGVCAIHVLCFLEIKLNEGK